MSELGEIINPKNLEHAYLISGSMGITSLVIAVLNRGTYVFDSARNIFVSQGNGLNSKIIKLFPKYSRISPSIDHLATGFGAVAAPGLLSALYLHSNFFRNHILENPMAMAFSGACMYLLYAVNTNYWVSKRRRLTVGDLTQILSDLGGVSAALYTVHKFIY